MNRGARLSCLTILVCVGARASAQTLTPDDLKRIGYDQHQGRRANPLVAQRAGVGSNGSTRLAKAW